MILAKINPLEEHLLEFSLNVQGTTENVTDVRFVIEGADYNLSFPCKTENGNVYVKIPKLKESVTAGMHNTKLEVVIGDKIFTPINESVEILENIKIDVSESVKVSNPEIKVSLGHEDGFNVVMEHGYQIMKKDDLYYGIIGESKTLRSGIGHTTLEQLINYLSK